ncbi:SsgA family sporulation/cell division regulator [Frankia sp. Hr75.2]|uniref:SsgA family sporulation/cell division regulator n=1 Tax=Parafrankia soli TaxID=2599596 RepID=UPI0028A4AA02|nr:SsgA family sporulation/cell division regulator [Frankia sp. Hr75.2]
MRGRPIVSNAVTMDVNATYLTGAEAGKRVPVLVTVRFDPLDPVAITLRTRVPDQRVLAWTFARELLAEGDERPVGEGTIRIAPVLRERRRLLIVDLPSPGGPVTVELPASRVADFVRRTYERVPASAESTVLDLDLDLDLGLAALDRG